PSIRSSGSHPVRGKSVARLAANAGAAAAAISAAATRHGFQNIGNLLRRSKDTGFGPVLCPFHLAPAPSNNPVSRGRFLHPTRAVGGFEEAASGGSLRALCGAAGSPASRPTVAVGAAEDAPRHLAHQMLEIGGTRLVVLAHHALENRSGPLRAPVAV